MASDKLDKALQAKITAATSFLAFYDSLDKKYVKELERAVFIKRACELWALGTYYHRHGNALLLSGFKGVEVMALWDKAVKCYCAVQKLAGISLPLNGDISQNYFELADSQVNDLLSAARLLWLPWAVLLLPLILAVCLLSRIFARIHLFKSFYFVTT